MRAQLKAIVGRRATFRGTFARFGSRKAWEGEAIRTLLLVNIIHVGTGRDVADHLWFNYGVQFERLNLQEGDVISFSARVASYTKGYRGTREDVCVPMATDYCLMNPTNLRKLED